MVGFEYIIEKPGRKMQEKERG